MLHRITLSHVDEWSIIFGASSKLTFLVTMASLNSNVHRVAQLCNLVSRPELNGVYVSVESYNKAKDRYAVQTLVPPNSSACFESILVKLSCLEFSFPVNFTSRYPHARVQKGTYDLRGYDEGIIFDYTSLTCDSATAESLKDRAMLFEWSCRVVGAPPRGLEGATTVFPGTTGVMFHAPGNDVIVEFENIHFTSPENQVALSYAKLVKFKNCRFSNGDDVVRVLDGSTAVFENCLFESAREFGMRIQGEKSHASVLNCTFLNCTPAVRALEGGTVSIIHCTFVNCKMAMYAGPRCPHVEYLYCSVTGGSSPSTMFRDGTNGTVKGSFWQGCEWDAVKVEGPKRSTVVIEDCVMDDCNYGIGTRTGKVDLMVINTSISKSKYNAVNMADNTTGRVELSGCKFSNNRNNIANGCGHKCDVIIDGAMQRKDDVDQRVAQMDFDEMQLSSGAAERARTANFRPALRFLRANKKVNIGDVRCENCATIEPPGVTYNICSKCKNVCYCTKECQVTHWKAVHKAECGKITYC